MPTYQYVCRSCAHSLEAVQSFSDAALVNCPECTGGLRKVFNSVGVVFKGSGFYRNDSRESAANGSSDKNGKQQPEKSEKGEASTAAKSSDSKDSSTKTAKAEPGKSATPTTAKPAATSAS